KMVVAHVLGHCDFFKNNAFFQHTSRNMVESMAGAANRFRDYEFKLGKQKVETFLDSVLSIQEQINPYRNIKSGADYRQDTPGQNSCGGGKCGGSCGHGHREKGSGNPGSTPYDDLWDLDKKDSCGGDCGDKAKKFPESPEKDLLLFIMQHSRDLEDWQRDVISVAREEMLYFWPQMETKIMNEGWATYWHMRIMRELDLDEEEVLEYAKMHSGVVQPSRMRINPYFLGLKIFEDIEKRWDQPTEEERKKYNRPGGEGRKKIFQVRETENDISFIRNYLTKEIIDDLDLYLFKKVGHEWKITDKEWEVVRDNMVASMTYCGSPYLVVEDGDFSKRGELYLKHQYEGVEMDIFYLERTLPHVYRLWGRPVHLETMLDNKKVLFSYGGEKVAKKFV
ncbi:MAG: SpoVR family protein, partial [Desulfocucumaceae bacterium]